MLLLGRCLLSLFSLSALLCARSLVEGYIGGAPPETCDTMLPVHQGATGFSDCKGPGLCPTVKISGVDIVDSMFDYDCSQRYIGKHGALRMYVLSWPSSLRLCT